MFGISFSEFIIIFAIALVVIGPEKIPETVRGIASILRKVREFADQIKGEVESELNISDIKNTIYDAKKNLKDNIEGKTELLSLKNELQDATKATEQSLKNIESSFKENLSDIHLDKFDKELDKEVTETSYYDEYAEDLAEHHDIEDDFYAEDLLVSAPKNYAAKVEKVAFNDKETDLEQIFRARLVDILVKSNPSENYLTYQMKYSQYRPLKNAAVIESDYYARLQQINKDL